MKPTRSELDVLTLQNQQAIMRGVLLLLGGNYRSVGGPIEDQLRATADMVAKLTPSELETKGD